MTGIAKKSLITLIVWTFCSLCWAELKKTAPHRSPAQKALSLSTKYSPEDLVQRSAVCLSAIESTSVAEVRKSREVITDTTNSQKLLLSYAHIQKQVMVLRSLGAKNPFVSRVGKASKETLRACSGSKPGNLFNKSLLNLEQLLKTDPEPSSKAQQDLQKRYLLASVEAARLDLQIDDGPFGPDEKKALEKQRDRILEAYPMATTRYPNTFDLEQLIDFSGNLYRGQQTYGYMDDLLFKQIPFDALPADPSSAPVAKLVKRLIHGSLPTEIADTMSASMAGTLTKPLKAVGEFCSLSPCHQMGIDKKATADVLSALPPSEQLTGVQAACNCGLSGNNPSFIPTLSATLAGGGAATGVACILAPAFCPAAVVTLVGASVGAAWSASETAAALYSDLTYADVLKDLPAATAGEWERLNDKNSKHLTELIETAVVGVAGGKAAQLAVNKILKHLPFERRAKARDIRPEGELRAEDIEQAVSAEGKFQYFLRSGKRRTQIRTDVTSYVIAANNDEGRELFTQVLGSGKQTAVMIDVNNLGLINYFADGTSAGDEYLGAVAKIIAEKSKSIGVPARWGGDEFVVSLNTTDAKEIMDFQQSIVDAVAESSVAKKIFSNERLVKSKAFKDVQKSKNYDDFPEDFKKILTEEEIEFAKESFGCFLASHFSIENKGLCQLGALSPSVSIGSSRVSVGKVEEAIKLADSQAAVSKIDLKSRLGQSIEKYTGRPSYVPKDAKNGKTKRRDIRARTKVLEPETPPDYKAE